MTEEKNIITLPLLEGNVPTHLKGIQILLEPHVEILMLFWSGLWATVLFVVIVRAYRNIRM